MTSEHIHLDIYFPEIKSNAHSMITNIAIDNDGVLFGGAVRDLIISHHYSALYNNYLRTKKERYNRKKFWDTNEHPETAARTLVADDLDIYFEDTTKSSKFIDDLYSICHKEGFEIEKEII